MGSMRQQTSFRNGSTNQLAIAIPYSQTVAWDLKDKIQPEHVKQLTITWRDIVSLRNSCCPWAACRHGHKWTGNWPEAQKSDLDHWISSRMDTSFTWKTQKPSADISASNNTSHTCSETSLRILLWNASFVHKTIHKKLTGNNEWPGVRDSGEEFFLRPC